MLSAYMGALILFSLFKALTSGTGWSSGFVNSCGAFESFVNRLIIMHAINIYFSACDNSS